MNKVGNIAFLNMDSENEIDDGIYIYGPHTGAISGISIKQYSMSKVLWGFNQDFTFSL